VVVLLSASRSIRFDGGLSCLGGASWVLEVGRKAEGRGVVDGDRGSKDRLGGGCVYFG